MHTTVQGRQTVITYWRSYIGLYNMSVTPKWKTGLWKLNPFTPINYCAFIFPFPVFLFEKRAICIRHYFPESAQKNPRVKYIFSILFLILFASTLQIKCLICWNAVWITTQRIRLNLLSSPNHRTLNRIGECAQVKLFINTVAIEKCWKIRRKATAQLVWPRFRAMIL